MATSELYLALKSSLSATPELEVAEELARLARREPNDDKFGLLSLSPLSPASSAGGTQLALTVGERLSEVEGTPLTVLPNAPTDENPQLKTALTRWPDGNVEGTLALGTPSRGGAIPKAYLVYVAAFDVKGTLVSTAQTELPGAGGTASVKLGLAPMAQHYQLALFAKPAPPKEEMVVAGYLVRHLAGDVLPSSTSQITLHEPHFYESNYYKTLSANLSASTANLADAAGYTVHGALFDQKGALLSTDQAPLKAEISLGFGITGQHAARYQLAVTAPAPKPQNFRLGEYLIAQKQATPDTAARGLSVLLKPELSGLTPRVAMRLPDDPEPLRQHAIQTKESLALKPQTARGGIALSRSTFNLNLSSLSKLSETPTKAPDASFTVASVKTETDGSLVLIPKPGQHPIEVILKNPKLRDYTQVKLTASVVAMLKTKGITEFVGKPIQANGKSDIVLNLARPAFEVTTVTVEKPEELIISAPKASDASFTVASIKTEEDGSVVLLPKPDQHPMEDILKNPTLRDYTQVKLAPSVVAALKAKGITEFVGKAIQANGKSTKSLYLAFPAFEVTTITVEKADEVQVVLKEKITDASSR